MDLFSYSNEEQVTQTKLLADRMRPRQLDQYIGQEHIVGPGKLLRRMIEGDQLSSIIFYGPPGCGKTTLAHIISQATAGDFVKLNAVDASVKDVREVIERAKLVKGLYGRKTILFLDEVHRFNASRQDALLPAVEQGIIIFIGATTENPFHYVNGALMSRSTLFQLHELGQAHVKLAMERALADATYGLGFLPLVVSDEALAELSWRAGGDIRRALNALELAALTTATAPDGKVYITLEQAQEAIRHQSGRTDESTQYDVLSAFHKSIRGSSDAALLWFLYAVDKLAMDPRTFLRRLTVACSEDIGLANPQAMVQAVAAFEAYERIGWPEAKYNIAQAILFAVESPKSNATAVAIGNVMKVLERIGAPQVPLHLQDSHYAGAAQLGHQGYQYPHDFPGHYVKQRYLPEQLREQSFYFATEQGTEHKIKQNQQNRRQ